MKDKKFEKLLNKEADKYVRENKDALMKSCGVDTKKEKPAILSVLPAVAAIVFLFAFAVICYIPVALKNNGTLSGTETAETTDTDGIYTQDFGTETYVTEETETMFDKSETETTMEIITQKEYELNAQQEEYYIFLKENIETIWQKELTDSQKNELKRCIANKVFCDTHYMTRDTMIEEGIIDESFPHGYFEYNGGKK